MISRKIPLITAMCLSKHRVNQVRVQDFTLKTSDKLMVVLVTPIDASSGLTLFTPSWGGGGGGGRGRDSARGGF